MGYSEVTPDIFYMKHFDRTNFSSSHPWRTTILNPLIILFVLILGLNHPRPILDYINLAPETNTFVNKPAASFTLKTPRLALKTTPKTTVAAPVLKTAKATTPKNYITLSGRNIEIFKSSDTNINAGSRVGLYGNGFLYGHRSTVFGSLGSIQTFSITLDGITKNYTGINRITLPKTCQTSTDECAEKYMGALTSNQSYRGQKYDLVLMTCAGTTDPNNPADATHRLIVFANQL